MKKSLFNFRFQTAVLAGCLALPALSILSAAAADTPAGWKVQVVGLMVVAPDGGEGNRSFCWKPGVTLSAKVTPPAGKIISVDDSQSKIESFKDDLGTDLQGAPASEDPFNKPGLSVMLDSSGHGEAFVTMDLRASGHPAKGAKQFSITGKLVAKTAGDPKDLTLDNAPINTNTVFNVGTQVIKITSVGKEKMWGDKEEFMVTFSSLQDLDLISSIDFFDPQGKAVEASKREWGGGFLGYMVKYSLKQPLAQGKMVVHYWTDLKTATVPFSIQSGVGI